MSDVIKNILPAKKKIVPLILLPQTAFVRLSPLSFRIQATKTSEIMASTVKTLMHHADFLEQFRADIGWEYPADCNDEENRCTLFSRIEINRQSFRAYVDGHAARNVLSLFLYPPYRVLEGKFVDTIMLFNFLNEYCQYNGRLCVDDDGQIRYKHFIDLDGIEPANAMIYSMLDCGIAMFSENGESIAAVALTRKTYEAIREEYDRKRPPITPPTT